jgi:dTDP-4-dehydrorhamnose 3,5-epimerase
MTGKIEGVKIKPLKVYQDKPDLKQEGIKPGIFIEILRESEQFFPKSVQNNFSIAYPGTIKAFHSHKYQDDLWFVASGRAAIVLYDARKGSRTEGITQVIYAGEGDYKIVLVPRGVVHGYKVVSTKECLLFYYVNKEYNRVDPDEQRIDPYDKTINFNWEKLK